MNMRPKTEKAVRTALDCFSGADGGVTFMLFRILIENLDAKAAAGDAAAQQLIDLIYRYAKLIDYAVTVQSKPK
jgi:hypothetical protein